jgi:hypothetical protein
MNNYFILCEMETGEKPYGRREWRGGGGSGLHQLSGTNEQTEPVPGTISHQHTGNKPLDLPPFYFSSPHTKEY